MRTRLWAKSRRLSAMKIIYVIIICADLRRYVWRNNSIFPQFSTFKMVEESVAREDGATLRRNKVWYWAWFVRPWSIGETQNFLRVSSSPTSSFFLHISSQGREQAKTGTPAGRFDPYYCWKLRQCDLHFAPIWVRQRSIVDAPATHCMNRSPNIFSCKRR